jgi:mannosyltransferase OCH1-like enzyme
MIVNGFWYGSELGELEKLCIDSWIKNGYEFYLWLYDDIEVSKDVIVKDANDIISIDQYFTYNEGHTKGLPQAFSCLFRAKLLYRFGGLWSDLDELCLKPYNFNKRFVFSEQVDSGWEWHVNTNIIFSQNKGESIFDDWSDRILSKKNGTITHGDLGPNLFTKLVIHHNLEEYVLPKEYFSPVDWESYKDIFEFNSDEAYGLHLYHSIWDEEDYKNIDRLR